ncbi:1,25-dihydroxyvitamin D(3) 24-hydroxylase, mitochondrial-like [Ptychodera flava]|uniref:1,25-dihydroxyvitamin D(3) 24-hydroxylase, mitochondrial-like n=1 Tax=Ptychodera flava TaxID=63121 RepID=UPI00396A9944
MAAFGNTMSVVTRQNCRLKVLSIVRFRSTAVSQTNDDNSSRIRKNIKPFHDIPGPKSSIVSLATSYIAAVASGELYKPWRTLTKLRQGYGPIWKQTFGSSEVVYLGDPTHFEIVLRNEGKYPKRTGLQPWLVHHEQRKLGRGVLLQDGPNWHRNRAALSKRMMRPREVASYTDAVNDVITELVKKVVRARDAHKTDNIVPDIENIMFNWSLAAASAVIYDKTLHLLGDKPNLEARAFIQAVHDMFSTTARLLRGFVPIRIHQKLNSWLWKKHLRAWDTIYATANKFIDERMNDITKQLATGEDIEEEADFITYMVMKGTLEVDELYANATELLIASVDTTSNSLLWVLYCLAKNPYVQESLFREIENAVPVGETPTYEHVNQMPYLKAILKETLRLYTPTVTISRVLNKDVVIGGYQIPAKTTCIGQTWLMSRDPEYFPDPLEFRPERWIRGENEHFYGFTLIPFGYGPRMCIGKRLAELQIHLALARLCRKFLLEYTTDVESKLTLVNTPDRPLNLKFIDRSPPRPDSNSSKAQQLGLEKKHLRAWDTIYATANKFIDERMNDITKQMAAGEDIGEEADFITYMVMKGTLELDEIYANATELLAASVDTTSNSLLWVLYCLAKNPHVQESLFREIQNAVPVGGTATYEHINQMPYLKATVRETLRLYTPTATISRVLSKDVVIGGYQIPAKTTCVGQTWLISRDPEYFPDPLEFRPERWIRGENEHFYGFTSIPFGYGPRMCIGKRLAELEIHLALARLCRKFLLEYTTDVESKLSTVNVPDRPLNLKFIDRSQI